MTKQTDKVDIMFECTKCAACCSQPDMIVSLTGRDIARIANGLGLTANQMFRVVDFYIASDETPLPIGLRDIKQVITEQGPAIIALKKLTSMTCTFLDDDLCMIHPLRPGACRAFPFVFSQDAGGLNWGLSAKKDICPGLGEGNVIDPAELESLASEVLEDIAISNAFIDEWNKTKEEPTAIALLEAILQDLRFTV